MGPVAVSEAAASVWWLWSLQKAALQSCLLGDWWVSTSRTKGRASCLFKARLLCFHKPVESFEPREGPSGEMLPSYRLATSVFHCPSLPSPCRLPLPLSWESNIMHSLQSSTTAHFYTPGIQLKANCCPIRKDTEHPNVTVASFIGIYLDKWATWKPD